MDWDQVDIVTDALIQMMRSHDADTADHLEATGVLAERLARSLSMGEDAVSRCRIAARLHDIGNVAIDPRMIDKPAALSEIDWDLVCLHPVKGKELVERIPVLAEVAPIIRAHHERIDGSGYPDSLVGEEIPLESRVISVVDAFHALTVSRPYRRILPVAFALGELASNAGAQFDEEIVAVFVESFGIPVRKLRTA
jgi:polar amino acid transport system substrate-binding protein